MENSEFNKIREFYNNKVKEHGHSPKACDYGRPESQLTKFNVIANMANFECTSILDVGCGFGDFKRHLKNRFKEVDYTGIDLSDEMINLAKKIDPLIKVRKENIMNMQKGRYYDYIIANGIFYLLVERPETKMKEMVEKMFEHSKVGVIFNSLSTWADKKEDDEFYADPCKTLEWCSKISNKIQLKHDYMGHDFTVMLSK